jgi:hypothetical protein
MANQILTFPITFSGVTKQLSAVAHILASAPQYDCNSIGNTVNTATVASQTAAYVLQTCSAQFSSLVSVLQSAVSLSASYGNIALAAYEAGTSISEQ